MKKKNQKLDGKADVVIMTGHISIEKRQQANFITMIKGKKHEFPVCRVELSLTKKGLEIDRMLCINTDDVMKPGEKYPGTVIIGNNEIPFTKEIKDFKY